MFFQFLYSWNILYLNMNKVTQFFSNKFLFNSQILPYYFHLNELLWQEGLLIDFLQKKIVDNWTRKFLIVSAYLFNERFLFDKVVRFYLDLIIWPLHSFSIFEFSNVSNTLFIILFFFILLFFLFAYFYLLLILFF